MPLEHFVTFTCQLPEAIIILNTNMAASVLDKAGLLQRACYKRHAGAANTQHLGQKFLR